jgi:hypothetical protein
MKKNQLPLPDPLDGPFLLAMLIGAIRQGKKHKAIYFRGCLETIGIRVRFAKDAPAIRHHPKVSRNA